MKMIRHKTKSDNFHQQFPFGNFMRFDLVKFHGGEFIVDVLGIRLIIEFK